MPSIELTTNLLAEIGGWPALKEARVMVERGRVHDARREGDIIRARVQGAEKTNEAQITLADRVANVEVRCTCAESRRTGRVCAHALAAGLALLQPARPSGPGNLLPGSRRLGAATGSDQPAPKKIPRLLIEDAPSNSPLLELTILLPLNLSEALGKDPIRIILESHSQPLDTVLAKLTSPIAVTEADDRVLTTLEQITGSAAGINAIPRGKIGAFLHALDNHPRVWLGKKQRLEIHATAERPQIILSTIVDALHLRVAAASGVPVPSGGIGRVRGRRGEAASERASGAPPLGTAAATSEVLSNWSFDGVHLTETPALPAHFASATRTIPLDQIPDFLAREFPHLERTCEIIFAPGTEEFRLEIAQPTFEAKLEGALSGLTLDLVAHYGEYQFPLNNKTEPAAYQKYFPASSPSRNPLNHLNPIKTSPADFGPLQSSVRNLPSVFSRRNVIGERAALAQVEAAGFTLVRSGAATFSLISENHVARFLANTLPRWRRTWTITPGPRLEATLAQIDIAQPEFSLKGGAGNDWLALDLKLSVDGKPIPIDPSEVQRWLQTGQSHARMANKRVLLVPTEAWSEMKEVLADCEVEQEPGQVRIGKTFAPYLAGALTAQGFRGVEAEPIHALTGAATLKAALDEKLLAQLRPYQTHGVEWLARLAQQNLNALLADDMGLGKTLQALAFAAWLRNGKASEVAAAVPTGGIGRVRGRRGEAAIENPQGASGAPPLGTAAATSELSRVNQRLPVLVVCPTSLVTNWLREAARFTPHLRTLDLTGPDRAEKFAQRAEHDLLITSYAILRRDIELYRTEEFSLVILDEAQHIKNRSSQNAQSAKALRARHRLILTGTPLENSVLDLWSLFDFLLPGYLGTAAEFRERYETPLTQAPDPKLMERLRHRVKPFFLRRTKEEVLTELPPKLDFPTLCELTAEQREVYRAVLAQGRRDVFAHSDKAGRKSGRDRLAVLTTLLRLRQVCCHLDLLPTSEVAAAVPSGGIGRIRERRGEAAIGNPEGASGAPPLGTAAATSGGTGEVRRWKEPSAKMDRTFELIDEAIDGGHRVLIFSQFVRVLHLLRDEAARRELRFCYLDGQTVERQAEVDRFQGDAGIPLFFISLKAGGTGLNLTGADTVIHFDPWWNPAVEEQATSRAHRMGQSRSVQAYKLIAAGTVEEKIQALQARKRELFTASLGGDEAFVDKLTGDDLEELLAE